MSEIVPKLMPGQAANLFKGNQHSIVPHPKRPSSCRRWATQVVPNFRHSALPIDMRSLPYLPGKLLNNAHVVVGHAFIITCIHDSVFKTKRLTNLCQFCLSSLFWQVGKDR